MRRYSRDDFWQELERRRCHRVSEEEDLGSVLARARRAAFPSAAARSRRPIPRVSARRSNQTTRAATGTAQLTRPKPSLDLRKNNRPDAAGGRKNIGRCGERVGVWGPRHSRYGTIQFRVPPGGSRRARPSYGPRQRSGMLIERRRRLLERLDLSLAICPPIQQLAGLAIGPGQRRGATGRRLATGP